MQLVGYIVCHVSLLLYSGIFIMLQWYLNQNY
jgi:hypothetical protein